MLDLQVQHMITAPSTILSPLNMLTVYHHATVLHYAMVYTTTWMAHLGTSRPRSFILHPSCKYNILLTQAFPYKFFQCTLLIVYHHAHAQECVCVCVCVCVRARARACVCVGGVEACTCICLVPSIY